MIVFSKDDQISMFLPILCTCDTDTPDQRVTSVFPPLEPGQNSVMTQLDEAMTGDTALPVPWGPGVDT